MYLFRLNIRSLVINAIVKGKFIKGNRLLHSTISEMYNRGDYLIDCHNDYVIDFLIVIVIAEKMLRDNRIRNRASYSKLHKKRSRVFQKYAKFLDFSLKIA